MKKTWRVIILIVLIAILLGALCVAVGFMTGADTARIYSVLDNHYGISYYIEYFNETVAALQSAQVF